MNNMAPNPYKSNEKLEKASLQEICVKVLFYYVKMIESVKRSKYLKLSVKRSKNVYFHKLESLFL